MNSFYSEEEVKNIGLKAVGSNVLISRFAHFYCPENIEIGDNVRIDDFCILSGNIKLANYIHISAFSSLYGKNGIEMEDYTGLSPRCSVFSASDDFSGNFLIGPMVNPKYTNVVGGKVLIKRYSQLGCNCVVMPNLTIEEGVVAGAMTLILNNLEAWSVFVGIPARFLKKRNRNLIKFIEKK